jgi:hypothetical protein
MSATIKSRFFLFLFAVEIHDIKSCRTVIFPGVFCEYETWSFTLREEHGLGVFENRLLRKIFGPKTEKVRQGWRKFCNELHDL